MTEELLVRKRSGGTEPFSPEKIRNAVKSAYCEIFQDNPEQIDAVTRKVVYDILEMHAEVIPITIIQSFVENRLIDMGLIYVAQAYIQYRLQHDMERYGNNVSVRVLINKNPN